MLSLKDKIKMLLGIILGLAVFVIWENGFVPLEWMSICGVLSMFAIFVCLYLILGTYGSRNLREDDRDEWRKE